MQRKIFKVSIIFLMLMSAGVLMAEQSSDKLDTVTNSETSKPAESAVETDTGYVDDSLVLASPDAASSEVELGLASGALCFCTLQPSCSGGTLSAATRGCGASGCQCVAAAISATEDGVCYWPPVAAICNP